MSHKKAERHYVRIRKTERGVYLIPASRHDMEYVNGWPTESLVEITIHKGRSRHRHRLYWATLHAVCENHDLITSAESLHKMLLIGCGVTEPLFTVEGEMVLLPSSTSFESMSESEFNAYFKQAMKVIAAQIIPGIDLNLLLDEARKRSDTGERRAA